MWIVKDFYSPCGFPYMCVVGPGSSWSQKQRDAKRFDNRDQALYACEIAYDDSGSDSDIRIVRLCDVKYKAIKAAIDYIDNYGGDSTHDRVRFRMLKLALEKLK